MKPAYRSLIINIIAWIEIVLGSVSVPGFFYAVMKSDLFSFILDMFFAFYLWAGIGLLQRKPSARILNCRMLKFTFGFYLLFVLVMMLGLFHGSGWDIYGPGLLCALIGCVIFIPPLRFLNHPDTIKLFK